MLDSRPPSPFPSPLALPEVAAEVAEWVFDRDFKSADLPIWLESLAGIDWLALHYSPVYYGWGVPRGDRTGVVVIPGFLGTDDYLQELYWWLRRLSYRPYLSRVGRQADCIDRQMAKLFKTVERAARETGGRVHLIGHSLGGMMARSVATQRPDLVASVITLGSPFRGVRSHPLVLRASDQVRTRIRLTEQLRSLLGRNETNGHGPDRSQCFTGYCRCAAIDALARRFPPDVPQTAIYTKADGIVDWQFCRTGEAENDFEVWGTHVGLAFNSRVYRLIGQRLAQFSPRRMGAVG